MTLPRFKLSTTPKSKHLKAIKNIWTTMPKTSGISATVVVVTEALMYWDTQYEKSTKEERELYELLMKHEEVF